MAQHFNNWCRARYLPVSRMRALSATPIQLWGKGDVTFCPFRISQHLAQLENPLKKESGPSYVCNPFQ